MGKRMKMSLAMKSLVGLMVFVIISFLVSLTLYIIYQKQPYFSLTITFFTTSYHFIMRCIVGYICRVTTKNKKYDYTKGFFKENKLDSALFRLLKIRKWKDKIPTAYPEQFAFQELTEEDLLWGMTQAEIGHTSMFVCSYIPLFFIFFFGEPLVFVLTSFFASLMEIPFILVQRYNRPLLLKYIERKKRRTHDDT